MMPTSPEGAAAPRQARPDDLPAIRRLVRAAYARYDDRMDRPPAPVLNDYQREVAAGQIWVIGDPIAGLIVLIGEAGRMLIENVAVAPSEQGKGIGRLLLNFAEEQAAARGLSRLTLYTNEVMLENLALYARLGYRETARRGDSGYARVFMEKTLA